MIHGTVIPEQDNVLGADVYVLTEIPSTLDFQVILHQLVNQNRIYFMMGNGDDVDMGYLVSNWIIG